MNQASKICHNLFSIDFRYHDILFYRYKLVNLQSLGKMIIVHSVEIEDSDNSMAKSFYLASKYL
jgi:hypothetical protein